jgi:hypothetical protein
MQFFKYSIWRYKKSPGKYDSFKKPEIKNLVKLSFNRAEMAMMIAHLMSVLEIHIPLQILYLDLELFIFVKILEIYLVI